MRVLQVPEMQNIYIYIYIYIYIILNLTFGGQSKKYTLGGHFISS